jgi:hypothetical protein
MGKLRFSLKRQSISGMGGALEHRFLLKLKMCYSLLHQLVIFSVVALYEKCLMGGHGILIGNLRRKYKKL